MKQIHGAQGCLILAAWIQSPSSDSNYHPLKSLLYPIPGFSNPSKTYTNLTGTHRSFQNLPVASGIHSVWGKLLSSSWTSVFCYHSLAFSERTSSHHGDSHSEQPHHWCCDLRRRLDSSWHKQRHWEKKHYHSKKDASSEYISIIFWKPYHSPRSNASQSVKLSVQNSRIPKDLGKKYAGTNF